MHASSQILAVRYSDQRIQFVAISAHAPHEHVDDTQKDKFWNLLSKVTAAADGLPVILGIDGNARIGEITDRPSAATAQMQKTIMADDCMLIFWSINCMCLQPSTPPNGPHRSSMARGAPKLHGGGWTMSLCQ